MSRKQLVEDLVEKEVKTFADNPGLPQKEHEKRLAKEKHAKETANKSKQYKSFYTMSGQKILLVTCKPNGAYSTYIGKTKTFRDLDVKIAEWKEQGRWVPEHEAQTVSRELVAKAR